MLAGILGQNLTTLEAVGMLGSVHGVTVSVQHVGRVSDELATLADELSR